MHQPGKPTTKSQAIIRVLEISTASEVCELLSKQRLREAAAGRRALRLDDLERLCRAASLSVAGAVSVATRAPADY